MNRNHSPSKQHVLFQTRKDRIVTCPYCWTDQRTERNFCYQCGAGFSYGDEAKPDVKPSSFSASESPSPVQVSR